MKQSTNAKPLEYRILGIDPGTTVMGYGVVEYRQPKLQLLQYGVIHLAKYGDHAIKLQKIFERITSIIEEYLPDFVALEAPFHGKNVQSMLKLGRAQGVAMAASLAHGIPISEYAPKRVKQAVTGNGNASKEQVAKMMQTLLKMDGPPPQLDATDALAVALCHHYSQGRPQQKGAKSWNAFLKQNPERLK